MNSMNFWNKICGFVLLLTFSCLLCAAQNAVTPGLSQHNFSIKNKNDSNGIFFKSPTYLPRQTKKGFQLSQNYATCFYGFFCRQEVKIEKATGIPLRFRLGSLEQCNYYEGKGTHTHSH